MAKTIVLYNPLSGNCTEEIIKQKLPDCECYDVTKIQDYAVFISDLMPEDSLILCGGDGTLNRFFNDTEGVEIPCEILYYPVGTGNDFALM